MPLPATPCAAVLLPIPWKADLLVALLFVILGQQLWLFLVNRRSRSHEELFRIVTENTADMIAWVDAVPAACPRREREGLHHEILRPRMMHHNRRSRLLRFQ